MRTLGLLLVLLAGPVRAEEAPLPDFATCMAIHADRYERDLKRHKAGPEADSFEIGSMRPTDFCGTVGIVLCDRSEAPLPCQHALAEQQEAMRQKVLAVLPAPEEVAGRQGAGSDALYPAVYALAHDRSAGDDCAGDTEVMAAWCAAREANRRLASAVLAWQLARYLDAAPPATEAGWARPAPPTRPRSRPEGGE